MSGDPDRPLIVIAGATATGKTRLGIQLAQALNSEIISADSRQIYRYMDIGTAKATTEEQSQVTHHLIDVVNPDETLTLAQYQDQAYGTIDSLHRQGKIPLLVGGTGQYITAIVEGWSIPRIPPNRELREELEEFARINGAEALHKRLTEHDPAYAARTHPNNIRRVVRALEVCLESGESMTELQRSQPPPYRMHIIGLMMPRDDLYRRADERVNRMIEKGFLEEVKDLLTMGYSRDLPAMSGVGYRELTAHLLDDLPLAEAIQQTKFRTHDFIRRQDVWFRGHDPGIIWHNSIDIDTETIIMTVRNWLQI